MLNVLNDRVIIDSHEPTKEQCETMTLLANALDASNDFKTVTYRSGYAEFERVGEAGELKFYPSNIISVYSNNGSTLLSQVGTDSNYWYVTDIGVDGGTSSWSYVYEGTKTFLGVSTVPNTATPEYPIGSMIPVAEDATCYIVEGGGSSMSKSYDLSTSTKWANLADGDHVVKLKAKGAGFGDSSFSNSVTVKKAATGETWVLKDDHQLQFATRSWSYGVNFVSNGTGYNGFEYSFVSPFESSLKYDDTIVYDVGGSQSWVNQSFRTVVFLPDSLPLPDDLLTWLQANGTKQGGGTEHTLTFSGVTVTVDGASVTSPYMLTKDCTIVATTLSPDKESMSTAPYININGSSVTSYGETISISKSDIKMLGHKGDTELSVTINYTA